MRKPTISTDAAFGFATSRRILLGAVLVGALLALTMQAASAGHKLKVDINDPGCSNLPRSLGATAFTQVIRSLIRMGML